MLFRQSKTYVITLASIIVVTILVISLVLSADLQRDQIPYLAPGQQGSVLGTDAQGDDVLLVTLRSAGVTVFASVGSVIVAMFVGVGVGGFIGLKNGLLDSLFGRIVDSLLAIPSLLLAMTFVAILGTGLWQVSLAVGCALIPTTTRIVRAAVHSIRSADYIYAARILGGGDFWILRFHVLPVISPYIVSTAMIAFSWSIINIASLDFLGLTGGEVPATLGELLAEGRIAFRMAPHLIWVPGIVLIIMTLTVQVMGQKLLAEFHPQARDAV